MGDRPIECHQCKKPACVTYKEIVAESTICSEMCADCPVLQGKLHGDLSNPQRQEKEWYCGHCNTSFASVKMGECLGCTECYSVFGDFLIGELISTEEVPPSLQKKGPSKRLQAIHIGKSPDAAADLAPSSQLTSLNEALNDALKGENYEQAAWLRDQIRALKGSP
jgi:protein arginine kinase activator